MLIPASADSRFGLGYAVAAYVVIFVAFFGYVAVLHLAARRLGRRIDALERAAGERGAAGVADGSGGPEK